MLPSEKVVLVTGGARGIGRAIALSMGHRGYRVAVNYQHSKALAEETATLIRESGAIAECFQADVSDAASVKQLFSAVEAQLGFVSILVNNAGMARDNLLMRMKEEEWQEVLSTNLGSVYYCTKEAIRGMIKARWGRIISISSVVALTGNVGQANYAAAKAGVIGFTRSVARECASRGITANVVAPGFIETDMTLKLPEEVKKGFLSKIPLGYSGKPEDVAETVAFLASEEARYITGQVIAVDGGMTM